jgi:hypothetical protein
MASELELHSEKVCFSFLLRLHFSHCFRKFTKTSISFIMAYCPSVGNNSAPTGCIFIKIDILLFPKTFHYNLAIITDAVHEDLCTFIIISDNREAYEIMHILMVEPDRPQIKIQYGSWVLLNGN